MDTNNFFMYVNFVIRAKGTVPVLGFPGGLDGKESACSAGNLGSIPGSRRSPGEGNGYPLQYSHLGNSIVRGAWWTTVHRVAENQTQLSD